MEEYRLTPRPDPICQGRATGVHAENQTLSVYSMILSTTPINKHIRAHCGTSPRSKIFLAIVLKVPPGTDKLSPEAKVSSSQVGLQ